MIPTKGGIVLDILEDARIIWREALTPGVAKEDFTCELYRELAFYLNISEDQVKAMGENSQEKLNYEWEKGSHGNAVQFYRQNMTYLYNLVHWHANYGEVLARVKAMQFIQSKQKTNVLDFGSGIGSTAMLFAVNGLKVTAADVSDVLLLYVKYRMERHGLAIGIINLSESALPANEYDAVTAIDVLEHIEEPKKVLHAIALSLREGGFFCFNVCGNDGAPMHITEAEHVLRLIRLEGFRYVRQNEVPLFIFQKVPQTLFRSLIGLLALGYYSLRLLARRMLTSFGVYPYLRRMLKSF